MAGIDKARFKKQVVPGDQMILNVVHQRTRSGISRFEATAKVDDVLCCSAEIIIAKNEIES